MSESQMLGIHNYGQESGFFFIFFKNLVSGFYKIDRTCFKSIFKEPYLPYDSKNSIFTRKNVV